MGALVEPRGRTIWLQTADDASSIAQIERLMAESRSVAVRRELGAALTLHDDVPRLTAAVGRVLDREDDAVRAETLAWMGRHAGMPTGLALLRRGLDDPSPGVRDEAITALSGDRGFRPAMIGLLRTSPYADVRQEIAQRLSGGDDATVAALLRAAFDDRSNDVQSEAVDSIKETRGSAARSALREIAARHPDRRLRSEARDALDERGADR
jgi:HEAT repeat protein